MCTSSFHPSNTDHHHPPPQPYIFATFLNLKCLHLPTYYSFPPDHSLQIAFQCDNLNSVVTDELEMSLKLNTVVGSLRPSQVNILFLNVATFHRLWRPPRRKRSTYLVIHSNLQLSSSLYSAQDTLFHGFLSQLNSLDLLAPALGFTSVLAILYNSTFTTHPSNGIGDWILFTSPTPFNRFVKLRCESLLLEDSNEKLIKEDGHLVSFDTGPIQQTGVNHDYNDDVLGKQLSYQRICVNTDDGGVVSLDWPANLDLTNELGLDTTVLVVAGTTDGSMDENVMSFVYECLKRGCFPIVMNPRGCARSPLTTPRLFTAADSDDVCTVVQFINRARPWTTLMGVGFGYGANMLTKYLAEVGEETPLTAATCLDNPFDLERATKSPNHRYVNQNLTDGLIDMLKSNKELFQGRSKGFDIEKALQAKSLQEFEEAISMVSYGFDSIQEFYVNSSTRDVVGKVKIPLLFIQDDVMPSFSIPRGLIAENPYTSLLTCSLQSKDKSYTGTSAVSWCQHLVVEWLTSIELGLLKGRHPLLEDTDVTINPSKSLKLMASKSSHSKKMLKTNDTDSSSKFEEKDKDLKKTTNGAVTKTNSTVVEAEVVKEGDVDLTDSERGKLLQATEVVMNMLDVTMPEALSEEQKKKVRTAIGKGETLMTALQGAVPEEVRGKLTTAVTGILESQKKTLNGLTSITKIPDVLNKKILKKEPKDTSDHSKNDDSSKQKTDESDSSSKAETSGSSEDKVKPGNEGETKEEKGDQQKEETNAPNPVNEETPSPSSPEDGVPDDTASGLPSLEPPPALDAITGIDDSTQVAVNSVFSVIEGVITQVEGETDDESETDNENEVEETSTTESEKKHQTESKSDLQDEKSIKLSTDSQKTHQTNTSTESEKKHQTKSKSDLQQKKDEEIIEVSTDTEKKHQTEVEETSTNSEKKHQIKSKSDLPQKKDEKIIKFSGDSEKKHQTEVEDTSTDSEKMNQSESKSDLQQKNDEKIIELSTDSEKKHQTEVEETSTNSEKKHQTKSKSDLPQKKDEKIIKFSRDSEKKHPTEVEDTSTDSEKKHQSESKSDLQPKKDKEIIKLSRDSKKKHQTEVEDKSTESEKKHQTKSKSDLPQKKDEAIIKLSTDSEKKYQTKSEPDLQQKKDEESIKLSTASEKKHQTEVEDTSTDSEKKHQTKSESDSQQKKDEKSIKLSTEKKDEGKSEDNDDDDDEDVIEPDYVILDSEDDWDKKGKLEIGDDASVVLMQRVKENILKSLKVEVCRRIDATEMEDMAETLKKEVEHVANEISVAVVNEKQHIISWDGEDMFGHGNPYAERILDTITSAVEGTTYLKKSIPLGIVVGSSLASLTKVFKTAAADPVENNTVRHQLTLKEVNQKNNKVNSEDDVYEEQDDVYEEEDMSLSTSLGNNTVMAGAVTAALGASALFVQQQGSNGDGLENSLSSFSFNQKENHEEPGNMVEENTSKSNDNNIVTSLAEKAMSVAAPVVPKKEDGAVDQDRLVAMLADLGQRGGILRLVGKFALLWGGIRGAMSLIGKLISFLKLSKRPLYQRILGFAVLVVVLWTPVVVPLLPTLLQNWATKNSSANGFAELACIIGLYGSVVVLVVLWGKRIRGYENPLEKYGLNFKSTTQMKNLALGLMGGVMFVSLIQFTNMTLGFVSISWSATTPSSADPLTILKLTGDVVRIAGQGLITATAIALVEELLFRSWLTEEIATDLGYIKGVILSAFAFSISQWSLKAIPGLWLLSIGLAGVRQRSGGSLAIPIGLRAGIMGCSFMLKEGGFFIFQPNYTSWIISGGDPFQPFSSIVGLVFALLWAIFLYPRNPKKENN
ncbi:uncharacterized protein LOC111899113 isoform X1 [Lactuca sativa]|uniref:uncharacterized protein LOC111899113 isoform X1 n=2 Tax=Lactuca sativa TaxID=4236 RepID=UPI000CD913F7|nr:uncharacterized protein LOC111899113 isoform X1 [Lactuca sativa]